MNVSELLDAAIKAGDKIYFRGEKVESIEITRDKDEPPIKVDLAHTRASYLDTITEQPQLKENQQIVLEWLKSTWTERKNMHWFPFEVIKLLDHQFAVAWGNVDFEEFKQIEKAKPHIKAYGAMTAVEQLPVLQAFSQWALEQEEE